MWRKTPGESASTTASTAARPSRVAPRPASASATAAGPAPT
jgi:hypothetical protein